MAATKSKGGRPKKPAGTRVRDQVHVGLRFDGETADKLRAILKRTNERLAKEGLPPLTMYALVRHWIQERASAEFEKL
jgi:hypothetical protein